MILFLENGGGGGKPTSSVTIEDLRNVLSSNPGLLEKFIMESVSLDTLEGWLRKKSEILDLPCRLAKPGKHKLSKWKVRIPG